jgi:putative membrane protein
MDNGILERHYSGIFTLPRKRFTIILGVLTIIIASLLYGTARAFFAQRYLLLGLSFIILILVVGKIIRMAFNGQRVLFLALMMLVFVEVFDFIVYHTGFQYLIALTPAIISASLVIILYFTSEASEGAVAAASISLIFLIYPINYYFSFEFPSRFHIFALTSIYVGLGILGTVTGSLYIQYLDKNMGFNIKDFLRGFLLFWLTSDPEYLEEKLQTIKQPCQGWIRCLSIGTTRLVSTSFHPGPFRNIGSATLVKKVLSGYNTMYLHSATNHDKNLVSHHEVQSLIERIDCDGVNLQAHRPFRVANQRFTITVFPFGHFSVMIVSGNRVIDDLTSEVQEYADRLGDILIVDAHNAYQKGYEIQQQDILSIAELIDQATNTPSEARELTYSFFKRHVTTPNICNFLALLLLDYGEQRYGLLMIDANNIDRKFREQVEHYMRRHGIEPIVISTDNHIKTGLPPKLEYKPAGADKGDVQAVFSFLDTIDFHAPTEPGTISYAKTTVEADVIGKHFLDNLEEAVVKLGRKAVYLFLGIIGLQLVVAILLGMITI